MKRLAILGLLFLTACPNGKSPEPSTTKEAPEEAPEPAPEPMDSQTGDVVPLPGPAPEVPEE